MKKMYKVLAILLSVLIVFSSTVSYASKNVEPTTQTVNFKKPDITANDEGPQNYIIKIKDKKEKTNVIDKIKKHQGKNIIEYKYNEIISAELKKEDLENIKKDNNIIFEKDAKVQVLEGSIQEEIIPSNIEQVKAPIAHEAGVTGQNVKVAIFDTGINLHPDLDIKGGISFIENSSFNTDENGHGTHVSGIIAALKNNEGIVGVAPAVELYSVKLLDKYGNGNYSSIIKGIEWAIDNDINVINMSLGGYESSVLLEEAINLAYDNNILIVASAGNTGDQMTYPAKYENVISVGAVDGQNQRTSFSSIGSELDVVAPGEDIKSTFNNGSYELKSGTSMASPHVVGILSLIWSKDLSIQNDVIKGLLYYSSVGLGDNFYYGNGLVDGSNALSMYDEYIQEKKGEKKTKKKKYISDNKNKNSSEDLIDEKITASGIMENYYLESLHPYTDNYSNTWTVSKAGATNIRVHFSSIDTEANYDFVRTSAGDSWSGAYNDVWSNWSGSSNINVTLNSDGSITKNGFYIDKIEYIMPTTSGSGNVESYTLGSPHPYTDNYSNTWTVSKAGATNIRVHFSNIDTEANYDFVRTSAGDSWSGAYNDVWSNWSGSSNINVTLNTDGSVTKNGFYIDKIEYIVPSSLGGGVEYYTLESPHPYQDNYTNTWTVSKQGATNIRVHFSSIDTELNYDFVRTNVGDAYSGSGLSDVWSSWSGSSSINVTLTSDGSITKNGFSIDKIEYMMPYGTLQDYEVAVDNYWPDEEDTPYPSVPKIGYLSGHINPPTTLMTYDDAIFNDPSLVEYLQSTPSELNYNDTDTTASYTPIPYEGMTPPADAVATGFGNNSILSTYSGVESNGISSTQVEAQWFWLIPIAMPFVVRIGGKLLVKQTLKQTTKQIVIKNGHLAGKVHPSTGVRFSSQGFPQFTSKFNVQLAEKYLKSTNKTQFSQANAQLRNKINTSSTTASKFTSSQLNDIRNGKTPNGYVWHHHEKTGYLQLVNKVIHEKTGHTGGKAIWGSL